MQIHKHKKGMMGKIAPLIIGLIALVILVKVAAAAVPIVNTAGDTLNATGAPLASFFETNGTVMLVVMAGLLIGVVVYFIGKFKH